ncbi:hypothetical protein [Paenibacillus sedimenti]|uniref:Uncharacterized protein n=1 Tax=Paenibacillus sedimenti TaxID=2770274 RepID=A0A926KSU8_9BACL|nr:hypothetical protein [Paenibacillus sedimenti]MBD0381608.1 hypothetical protein [Paenibacillus sedimenti]
MSLRDREQWIKLDLLTSLARSQRALTRIIESVAHSVEASPSLGKQVAENLESIVRYQHILTRKITGIRIAHIQKGTPAHPWLNTQAGVHQAYRKPPS